MKPTALVAELFGTFSLTFAVLASLHMPDFPVSTPVVAGLTLGLFVYTIGPVSGCHINPAVTVGLAALRKIGPAPAAGYLVAQFAGAAVAAGVGGVLLGGGADVVAADGAAIGIAEALGALVLLFGIAAAVLGVVPAAASGVVIGGSLTLGIEWAAHTSNGVLNPAVAVGIGSLSPAYVWGPLVGAVAGALLCGLIARGRPEGAIG